MGFVKSVTLHYFDIFPKVFPADKEVEITIKPLGSRISFAPDTEYTIELCPMNEGCTRDYPHVSRWAYKTVKPCEDGCIRFKHAFPDEQEHFVRVILDGKELVELSVYSLHEDLCGRYPFIGDLHMHSTCSDGRQAPAVVASNYRRKGYDFMALTDHGRYYPSLRVKELFKDVPIELNLVEGEEVHMPKGDEWHINDVHIVNFGGEWSVNGLIKGEANDTETDGAMNGRSMTGVAPEQMTKEEFFAEVDALKDTLDIPDGIEKYTYACCQYIFDKIREANGLAIFPHPYWRNNVNHVPEKMWKEMFKNRIFDAFEVLGGEREFNHNGYQTAAWYEQWANGNRMPIVGSTDTHDSINPKADICCTMVFSPANERTALIQSIKDYYSVAIDTISTEYRIVGDLRLTQYASFLYENFFPLHDELCYEEGRAMKDYAFGEPGAKEILCLISGRMKAQREKYFAF
ncbi:MAG: PHP domain-containing protein [Clostridia bacterium]|nr:PHP domain-containing protein [Clostridia bacterium]